MIWNVNDATTPYDDDKLKYIYTNHRYVLELDNQASATGIDLVTLWQGNDNALMYLEMVSDVCYTYILRFKDSKYFLRMLYYLSHSEEMRRALYEMMIDTVRYNHEDGGFMIAYQTGINLHEMKELRLKIENAVSVIGDQIIRNYGLQQRVNNINMNDMTYFDTLTGLTDYLVELGYITAEDADIVEEVNDLAYDYRYRCFVNTKGQYVYEDVLTFETALDGYGSDW